MKRAAGLQTGAGLWGMGGSDLEEADEDLGRDRN